MGWGSSKRTTVNEDNRVINDLSGSTFDNSVDRSRSYEDNSYSDTSTHFTDESYTDTSTHYNDESYLDTSTHYNDESYLDSSIDNSGDNAGNSGTINITDGGAFDLVESVTSEFVGMGNFSLETMGKTAELSMEQSGINSGLMRDVANNALSEYTALSANSIGAIEAVTTASIAGSNDNVNQMKELTLSALQQMSAQSATAVSSSNRANRDALAASTKLMTTVSANGNDLLIDGVVNIAKYAGVGLASLVVGLVVVKVIGGNK